MNPPLRILAVLLPSVCLTAAMAPALSAEITVHLNSGRRYTAQVDERSDDSRLWLRFENQGNRILRPIDWSNVESAALEGENLDADQLRSRVSELATAYEPDVLEPVEAASPSPDQTPDEVRRPVFGEPPPPALGVKPQVRFVSADAYVANWDADVEVDGLVVRVEPTTLAGPLPVEGSVDVELIAADRRGTGQMSGFRRLGYWSRRLSWINYGPSGYHLLLPFQAVNPEFNTDIAPKSLVRVRLTVPGSGVFETTVDDVRIRPYSAVRDVLQLRTRKRFFPSEMTGRGR